MPGSSHSIKLNRFYLLGGRTPLDPAAVGFPGASILWNYVWTSDDLGASWRLALPEAFSFGDPLNYLRVDNDVWRWSRPKSPKVPLSDKK